MCPGTVFPSFRRSVITHQLLTPVAPPPQVPFYQWNGEYLQQPERPADAKKEEVDGKGFSPWQYASIHAS